MRYTTESSIGLETVVVVSADRVVSTEVKDIVILDLASGTYHELNSTAAFIWEYICQPRLVVEVCDAMLAEFDATPEQVIADVTALLELLKSEGLIRVLVGEASESVQVRKAA